MELFSIQRCKETKICVAATPYTQGCTCAASRCIGCKHGVAMLPLADGLHNHDVKTYMLVSVKDYYGHTFNILDSPSNRVRGNFKLSG